MEEPSRMRPKGYLPSQWVWFYYNFVDDPNFMLQCAKDFIPSYRDQCHLTLYNTVKCFTVGTHSRCLIEWWQPIGDFTGFFHHVKIIHTTRGPKEGNEEITFFYGKLASGMGSSTLQKRSCIHVVYLAHGCHS